MKLHPTRHHAFAMIFVLIAIMFTATIVVYFLASTGQERKAVHLYAESLSTRHLATMAVNRVIGQINSATREGTPTAPVLWASQPGMIRTFNTSGNLQQIYKLYSWDTLVDPGSGFDPASAALQPPANWASNPGLYTDLNQPIGTVYPIVDPAAEGIVAGFSIDTAHAALTSSPSNSAPMPVRWLYVLEDGQIVAPAAGLSIPGASGNNPIIGRIAYWTDDESSKVNLNTASEGAYWDWPKAATPDEMQFAGNPPLAGEYHRQPGHPAMTSLSAVFPTLSPGERWANPSYSSALTTLLSLTPRIPASTTGSQGGTAPVSSLTASYGPATLSTIPNTPIPWKHDRLLASPDELIFTPTNRAPQTALDPERLSQSRFFLTTRSSAPETTVFDTPRISLWPVTWSYPSPHAQLPNRQTAPVTLPDPSATLLNANAWMRPQERLLALTSTLNASQTNSGNRYFFQRQNPESSTHDWSAIPRNQELISYLQRLTRQTAPGFSRSLEAEMGSAARDFTLLNTFENIRSLVNRYTPNSDGTLLYAYAPVAFHQWRRADLSLATDYRESGAFQVTPLQVDLGSGLMTGIGQFPTLREVALVFYPTARRAPVPPSIPTSYHQAESWNYLIKTTGNPVTTPADNIPPGAQTTRMQAVLLLDFDQLTGGNGDGSPRFWVKVRQQGTFEFDAGAGAIPLEFDGATALFDYANALAIPPYLRPLYNLNGSVKTLHNGTLDVGNYGLVTPLPATDNVSPDAVNFTFTGSRLFIDLYEPTATPPAATATPITSYTIDLSTWSGPQPLPLAPWWTYANPSAPAPLPAFATGTWAAIEVAPWMDGATAPSTGSFTYTHLTDFRQRLDALKSVTDRTLRFGSHPVITPFDTVIAVVPDPTHSTGGDPRQAPRAPFVKIDTVFTGTPTPFLSLTDYPRLTTQHHSLGGGGATGYTNREHYNLLNIGTPIAQRGGLNIGGTIGAGGASPDSTHRIGAISNRPLQTIPTSQSLGDWSSRAGNLADGGLIPSPDQGYQTLSSANPAPGFAFRTPYFTPWDHATSALSTVAAQGSFSANRQIPSPITLLGAIPSSPTIGWQTLAFSPNPAIGATHPGLNPNAPHHLWLDLFWMPVVEPYAISEPFATAGKINLNHQIMPFTYLKRETGWHALLKSTWLTALPSSTAMVENYKSHDGVLQHVSNAKTRYLIDIPQTLQRIEGTFFRTASEISTVWLVPEGRTASDVEAFWSDKLLTSDTAREAPYDHLYSRVTTRSNTYTVHWRVQALQKVRSTSANVWVEGRDLITAELRGSTALERQLDPSATLPDYATDSAALPLSHFHRWRILSEHLFQP